MLTTLKDDDAAMNVKSQLPSDSLLDLRLLGYPLDLGDDEGNRLARMTEWIKQHSGLIKNRTVLDLGSNAGHFPLLYALLGASKVVAVEPREVFRDFFNAALR